MNRNSDKYSFKLETRAKPCTSTQATEHRLSYAHRAFKLQGTHWILTQVDDPLLGTYDPDEQEMHGNMGVVVYLPAGQGVHAMDPSDNATVPGAQNEHIKEPADGLYVPRKHLVQV